MNRSVVSMLVQFRNIQLAGRPFLEIAHSKTAENLGKLLSELGVVRTMRVFKEGKFKRLHFDLELEKSRGLSFRTLRLVSKPSRSIYFRASDLLKMYRKGRRGLILSSSRGLMTIDEAIKRKLGGEAICEFV